MEEFTLADIHCDPVDLPVDDLVLFSMFGGLEDEVNKLANPTQPFDATCITSSPNEKSALGTLSLQGPCFASNPDRDYHPTPEAPQRVNEDNTYDTLVVSIVDQHPPSQDDPHRNITPSNAHPNRTADDQRETLVFISHNHPTPQQFISQLGKKVFPGVYIGSASAARQRAWLRSEQIRGILNISKDIQNFFEHDTTMQIKYMRIPVSDSADENIFIHFSHATSFIKDILESQRLGNGSVLIHCNDGRCRAPAIAIAYAIAQLHWTLSDAFLHVYTIAPEAAITDAFKRQLMDFELALYGRLSIDFFAPSIRDRGVANGDTAVTAMQTLPLQTTISPVSYRKRKRSASTETRVVSDSVSTPLATSPKIPRNDTTAFLRHVPAQSILGPPVSPMSTFGYIGMAGYYPPPPIPAALVSTPTAALPPHFAPMQVHSPHQTSVLATALTASAAVRPTSEMAAKPPLVVGMQQQPEMSTNSIILPVNAAQKVTVSTPPVPVLAAMRVPQVIATPKPPRAAQHSHTAPLQRASPIAVTSSDIVTTSSANPMPVSVSSMSTSPPQQSTTAKHGTSVSDNDDSGPDSDDESDDGNPTCGSQSALASTPSVVKPSAKNKHKRSARGSYKCGRCGHKPKKGHTCPYGSSRPTSTAVTVIVPAPPPGSNMSTKSTLVGPLQAALQNSAVCNTLSTTRQTTLITHGYPRHGNTMLNTTRVNNAGLTSSRPAPAPKLPPVSVLLNRSGAAARHGTTVVRTAMQLPTSNSAKADVKVPCTTRNAETQVDAAATKDVSVETTTSVARA